MNPETLPRKVRYGTAEGTHLKFVTTGNGRRIAFEVTNPARGLPKSVTRSDMKRIERDARKQRVRELKSRNRQ